MYGFLGYPVSQAADIAFCKADLVPVGEDNVPHVEQTRRIVRRFNELYRPVLVEPRALVGEIGRLEGLDGNAKMSKHLNNAIFLSDPPGEVERRINTAVTDPARIHPADPGHPEVCTVYSYHQDFNKPFSEELDENCRAGRIGCVACKKRLGKAINDLLEPLRTRRAEYERRPGDVADILMEGTARAREIAVATLQEVREAIQIDYFAG